MNMQIQSHLPLMRTTLLILSMSAMLGAAAIAPNAALAFPGPPPLPGPVLGGPPPGLSGGPPPGPGLGGLPRGSLGGPSHADPAGPAGRLGPGGPPGLAQRGGPPVRAGLAGGRGVQGGSARFAYRRSTTNISGRYGYRYGRAAAYAYGAATGYAHRASRSYTSDGCYYTYRYSYRLRAYRRVAVCD
jgi:hypothetical protein